MTDRRNVENAVLRANGKADEMVKKMRARFEGEYLNVTGNQLARSLLKGDLKSLASKLREQNPEEYDKFIQTFGEGVENAE